MRARPLRQLAFRLAGDLGIWDVPGMMRAMPHDVLLEWNEYYLMIGGHPPSPEIETVKTPMEKQAENEKTYARLKERFTL